MKLKYIILMVLIIVSANVVSAYSSSGVKRAGADWWGFDSNLFGYAIYNGTFNGTFIGSNYTTDTGKHLSNVISEASYIIIQEAGTVRDCGVLVTSCVKAINGSSWVVDFSGTNAYTVIQNANNVSDVFIKLGTYILSSPLVPRNSIIGQSKYTTILKLADSINKPVIDSGASLVISDITISELTLDGNGYNQVGSHAATIRIFQPDNVELSNLIVLNSSNEGIEFGESGCYGTYNNVRDSNNSKIHSNIINGTGIQGVCGQGIRIVRNDNVDIYENTITHTDGQAISLVETYYGDIHDNTIKWSEDGGIYASYGSSYNKIYDNDLFNVRSVALGATTARGLCLKYPASGNACTVEYRNTSVGNIIKNNYVENTVYYLGRGIGGSDGGFTATGNIIKGGVYGIIITPYDAGLGVGLSDIILENNDISDATNGIYLASSDTGIISNGVTLKNNNMKNITTHAIYINLTNSNTLNNLVLDGNILSEINPSGINYDAILLKTDDTSHINTANLKSNDINNASGRGIYVNLSGTSQDIFVIGNNVNSSGSHQLEVKGNINNSIVDHNIISNTDPTSKGISINKDGRTLMLSSASGNRFSNTTTPFYISVSNTNYTQTNNYPVSPIDFGIRTTTLIANGFGDEYFNSTNGLKYLANLTSIFNSYMTLNKFIAGNGVTLVQNATSGELTINATSILPQCPSTSPVNGSMCLNYTTVAQNNYFNGNWYYTNGTLV